MERCNDNGHKRRGKGKEDDNSSDINRHNTDQRRKGSTTRRVGLPLLLMIASITFITITMLNNSITLTRSGEGYNKQPSGNTAHFSSFQRSMNGGITRAYDLGFVDGAYKRNASETIKTFPFHLQSSGNQHGNHITRLRNQQAVARRTSPLKEIPMSPSIKTSQNQVQAQRRKRLKSKNSKIFYFVHIHKSAGTTFCSMAHKNHLRTEHNRNCNVQYDLRCCGKVDTVEGQISYARYSTYDLVAIEKEMYDSMAPEYYNYVTILRNSRSRYMSHYNHIRNEVLGLGRKHSKKQTEGDAGSTSQLALPTSTSTLWNETFTTWYTRQPDNWNTRILCGPKCLSTAKFQISAELFLYTLQRLDKFEDILFVETFDKSYDMFRQKHNWSSTEIVPLQQYNVRRINITSSNSDGGYQQISSQGWDPLMSALDDALYEFSKRKMDLDATGDSHNDEGSSSSTISLLLQQGFNTSATTTTTQVHDLIHRNSQLFTPAIQEQLSNYFANGPLRRCATVCCAEGCSTY